MAKNVYLKRYIPEGQRHCVLNEANFKKMRPAYLLFAGECLTPIKDDDANTLVRQNPNVLSFKPLSKAAIEEASENLPRPAYTPDHVSKKILESDLNEDETTSMEISIAKAQKKKGKTAQKIEKVDADEFLEKTVGVKEVLENIAKMSDAEFNGMKLKEVRAHGESLGLKIPAVGIKTVDALKALNDRAAELMEKVKSDEGDYDADN